jgi:LysM repeat protein
MRTIFHGLIVILTVTIVVSAVSFCLPAVSHAAPDAAGGTTYYTVRRGDTLSAIARRFGVSVAAITRANRIRDPSRIIVGTRLVIPGAKSVATPRPNKPTPPPPPTPVTTEAPLIPTTRPQ